MKKIWPAAAAAALALALTACAAGAPAPAEPVGEETPPPVCRSVCYLVSGTLGDESLLDSVQAGLEQLRADGRAEAVTIEMGDGEQARSTWPSTLNGAAASGQYDLIVCAGADMAEPLQAAAAAYPGQHFLLVDAAAGASPNVACLAFPEAALGYLTGVLAACEAAENGGGIGYLSSAADGGGAFADGLRLGAARIDPDAAVATGLLTADGDPSADADALLDEGCSVLVSAAGAAGAQAVLERGGCRFIGVGADWERLLPPEAAAVTLTSARKNAGAALVWFFDRWDAGETYWGETAEPGIAENAAGLVTGGGYGRLVSQETRQSVEEARAALAAGEIDLSGAGSAADRP